MGLNINMAQKIQAKIVVEDGRISFHPITPNSLEDIATGLNPVLMQEEITRIYENKIEKAIEHGKELVIKNMVKNIENLANNLSK